MVFLFAIRSLTAFFMLTVVSLVVILCKRRTLKWIASWLLVVGGTAFIGPYGETLTAAPDGREAAIAGEIDLQHLADYHAKFPVLEDADAFKTL